MTDVRWLTDHIPGLRPLTEAEQARLAEFKRQAGGGEVRVIQVDSGEQIRRARELGWTWQHTVSWCKTDGGLIVVSHWDEEWELLGRLELYLAIEDLPEKTIDYARVVVDHSTSTRK
jgi:hypothetical protein